jgi:hypothetical protein
LLEWVGFGDQRARKAGWGERFGQERGDPTGSMFCFCWEEGGDFEGFGFRDGKKKGPPDITSRDEMLLSNQFGDFEAPTTTPRFPQWGSSAAAKVRPVPRPGKTHSPWAAMKKERRQDQHQQTEAGRGPIQH